MKRLLAMALILMLALSGAAALAETGGSDTAAPDWSYHVFDDAGLAVKLPGDFAIDDAAISDPVVFQASGADVFLQVQAVDGTFDDLDALMEYLSNQEYVIRAAQVKFNDVDLVYAEGADDGARLYASLNTDGSAYVFVFIPQTDDGEDLIVRIISTICPSHTISK